MVQTSTWQELRQGVVYGELGDLVSGRKAGRTAADQITVCDLTGTGAQDTAIALFALEKAEELGLGLEVNPAIPISRVWADPKR